MILQESICVKFDISLFSHIKKSRITQGPNFRESHRIKHINTLLDRGFLLKTKRHRQDKLPDIQYLQIGKKSALN